MKTSLVLFALLVTSCAGWQQTTRAYSDTAKKIRAGLAVVAPPLVAQVCFEIEGNCEDPKKCPPLSRCRVAEREIKRSLLALDFMLADLDRAIAFDDSDRVSEILGKALVLAESIRQQLVELGVM